MNKDEKGFLVLVGGIGLTAVVLVGALMYAGPQYGVWRESLSGKAELQKAEYTRQVAVLEAQAKLDSAKRLGDAEVVRAKGVAEANKIIGDSLKNNPAYLQYLWITEGEKSANRTVYMVPSSGGAPVPTFDIGEQAPMPQK